MFDVELEVRGHVISRLLGVDEEFFLQLHEDLGSDSYITREHTTDTYITGAILVPSDRR